MNHEVLTSSFKKFNSIASKKLYILICFLICIGIGTTRAQYTVLHNFNDTNGGTPWGNLTLSGNKLYGVTAQGGANSDGLIFSIGTNGGSFKDLFNFNGINGLAPICSLTLSGRKLYGTTYEGGVNGVGLIFSIDTNGSAYKILWSFDDTGINGAYPYGSLTLLGAKLYGMSNGNSNNHLNIFSVDTSGGGYRNLYNFNIIHGGSGEALTLSVSGKILYGTLSSGGVHDSGFIFSIDTNGSNFKDLFDFTNTKGYYPEGSLTLVGNKLYGMTTRGGVNDDGCIFTLDTNGSGYKDLFNFKYRISGSQPTGALTLSGTVFYGMTFDGGSNYGTVFSIDTNGNGFRRLHHFNDTNGATPQGGNLTISGNMLYGMTIQGGPYNGGFGVIFRIDTNTVDNDSNLSIIELTQSSGVVQVFPNPSNGKFTIQLANSEQLIAKCSVEVYNMLGELIYSNSFSTLHSPLSIDISNNTNGIYLYRVTANSGELMGEGKLVIQK